MKLLCKTITSHTCLEIFQSTNDTKPKRWRLVPEFFGRLKNAEEEEVNRKWHPKVNKYSEKVVCEKIFSGMAEW